MTLQRKFRSSLRDITASVHATCSRKRKATGDKCPRKKAKCDTDISRKSTPKQPKEDKQPKQAKSKTKSTSKQTTPPKDTKQSKQAKPKKKLPGKILGIGLPKYYDVRFFSVCD